METIAKTIDSDRINPTKLPVAAHGNRRPAPVSHCSIFPPDAAACIFRPSRSVMTSGRARTKSWRIAFERRTPPYIEPLMGWTGGDDTLAQIELSFPTLESATAYAERQGLAYQVEGGSRHSEADYRRLSTTCGSRRNGSLLNSCTAGEPRGAKLSRSD